jgi:hypothetical protein
LLAETDESRKFVLRWLTLLEILMHAGGDTVTESISCENDYKLGMQNPQIF